MSDIRSQKVVDLYESIGIPGDISRDDIRIDAAILRKVAHTLTYHKMISRLTNVTASGIITQRSGDCGYHSALTVALYRAAGIPSRGEVGYLLSGKIEENGWHMRVARYANGWWVHIEATSKTSKNNPELCIGSDGFNSPDFLTLTYGFHVKGKVVTSDKVEHSFGKDVFQLPILNLRWPGPSTKQKSADYIAESKWHGMMNVNKNNISTVKTISTSLEPSAKGG